MAYAVQYQTSEEIADKVYDSLSYKYALKKTGSWYSLLVKRSEDMVAPNSVHFKTIKDFLNIKVDDLLKIKNFSEKRSKIIYESIQKCITDVELHKLQHASGIFDGLGSKKLALLSNFTEKPKIEDLLKIDGFSHKSANLYIDNYDNFLEFLKDLNIKIKKQDNIEISDNLILSGKTFVFTQVRMPNEEKILKSNGAIISENINKNTSYLICSDKNKNTNKIEKAKNLGIEILNVDEFLVKFIN
jgi:NAD-dependent DNA ligase